MVTAQVNRSIEVEYDGTGVPNGNIYIEGRLWTVTFTGVEVPNLAPYGSKTSGADKTRVENGGFITQDSSLGPLSQASGNTLTVTFLNPSTGRFNALTATKS